MRCRTRCWWDKLRGVSQSVSRRVKRSDRGQGLVELALTLPVLLIMFLGLIELAFALRAYLVLVNANREAARFASRGSTFTDEQIAARAMTSFAGQLPARTTGPGMNTGIIITRFFLPADPQKEATYSTPVYVSGTLTQSSRIDPEALRVSLKVENDDFNADLLSTHPEAVRTSHDMVFVEIYYYHNQVLHAPIVEWVFPEPMVLYSRTAMRVGSSRVQ